MSKGLYPIRTISAMTGVNPVTLRAWERRYGLICPQRTPKGHRLYTERDIDRIKQILVLMERGIPISQAKQVLDESEGGIQADVTATAEPDQGIWGGLLERMNTGISVYDEQALDDVYEEALSLFPASQVQHHLLEPLYRRHGHHPGNATSAFTLGWLRTALGVRYRHRSRRASGPRLLLATATGSASDIPLLLLALEAVDQGYRPVLIHGASDSALWSAVHDSGVDALLLWVGDGAADTRAPDDLSIPAFLASDGDASDDAILSGTSREIIGTMHADMAAPGYATA